MFDNDLDLLRTVPGLLQLLETYASQTVDREAWLDRVMQLGERPPAEIVRLHGWLLAQGWLDQNTGDTSVRKPDTVACCYRVTLDGLRMLRRVKQSKHGTTKPETEAA
jgi:hypothetical protein